jgi:hypothetical protein
MTRRDARMLKKPPEEQRKQLIRRIKMMKKLLDSVPKLNVRRQHTSMRPRKQRRTNLLLPRTLTSIFSPQLEIKLSPRLLTCLRSLLCSSRTVTQQSSVLQTTMPETSTSTISSEILSVMRKVTLLSSQILKEMVLTMMANQPTSAGTSAMLTVTSSRAMEKERCSTRKKSTSVVRFLLHTVLKGSTSTLMTSLVTLTSRKTPPVAVLQTRRSAAKEALVALAAKAQWCLTCFRQMLATLWTSVVAASTSMAGCSRVLASISLIAMGARNLMLNS